MDGKQIQNIPALQVLLPRRLRFEPFYGLLCGIAKKRCEKPPGLLVGHGWSNDTENMLFSFVRDKPRIVQGRRFRLDQLDLANRVCRSRSSTERPTYGTRTWGAGLLRRIQGQDVS